MHTRARITKAWAYISFTLTVAVIAFLFIYVFTSGFSVISWQFITDVPRGSVLGSEGGIWPAIVGSVWFTLTALILGGIPAVATAVYVVYCCRSSWFEKFIHTIMQSIAGIPSIVLGLFSYSLLVRTLGFGRCILSGGIALAIMILPFIETRTEKAMRELPKETIFESYALGCSRLYTILHIVFPAIKGELVSGLILGGCFAMGATAPLIFTGGVAFASVPNTVMEPAMALPLHLYLLLAQGTSMPQAYGTAFVLMLIVLVTNIIATFYSRRKKRRWK
ncbi:MAG: ABC transporter permease subunit [Oscillospiraceae bacterium]|nr:ABC transporter permease subunit [Oscillospiraceae bacterium]